MNRIPWRPEAWLPWLTVLGFGCYVASWLGRESFYRTFHVSSEMVGVNYPALLIPTAVLGAFIVLLVAAVTTLVLPVFMPISRRAAWWQMKVGGSAVLASILSEYIVILTERNPPRVVQTLPVVPFWFGALLFAHGISAVSDRLQQRRRACWLRWRATSPEQAHDAIMAYLRARRLWRRQRAVRRAKRAEIRREALPAALLLVLSLAIFLFLALAVYVNNAATHAANNVIEGRNDSFFVGADLPAAILLNVRVRPVKVDAIAPQFRSLQKAQMLYLGINGGAYVLYDRTARQAV